MIYDDNVFFIFKKYLEEIIISKYKTEIDLVKEETQLIFVYITKFQIYYVSIL